MTDDVLILVIWIIGVIAFGFQVQIVIKEVFDAIQRSAEREESEYKE